MEEETQKQTNPQDGEKGYMGYVVGAGVIILIIAIAFAVFKDSPLEKSAEEAGVADTFSGVSEDEIAKNLGLSPDDSSGIKNVDGKTPEAVQKTGAALFNTVQIALISSDNGGGLLSANGGDAECSSNVNMVSRTVEATSAPLRASLIELLSTENNDTDENYNALAGSNLVVGSLAINNGTAVIDLEGEPLFGGACDSAQAQIQIEQTAMQFPSVNSVIITINGAAIKGVLNEKSAEDETSKQ